MVLPSTLLDTAATSVAYYESRRSPVTTSLSHNGGQGVLSTLRMGGATHASVRRRRRDFPRELALPSRSHSSAQVPGWPRTRDTTRRNVPSTVRRKRATQPIASGSRCCRRTRSSARTSDSSFSSCRCRRTSAAGPQDPDGRSRRRHAGAHHLDATDPYTLPHVGPGEKPGTFTGRYRFADSGQYAVAASAKVGPRRSRPNSRSASSAGPVFRTTILLDAIVVLIFGALIFSAWRARARRGRIRRVGAPTRRGGG